MSAEVLVRRRAPEDLVGPVIAAAFADEGEMVARLAGHEDWMTGQLSYRDVWWRHDAAGLRDPLLTQIEESTR